MSKTCNYRHELHGDTLELHLTPKCGKMPESVAVRVIEVLNPNPGVQIATPSGIVGMNAVRHALRRAAEMRKAARLNGGIR